MRVADDRDSRTGCCESLCSRVAEDPRLMQSKIKAVRAYVAATRSGADYHAQESGHWIADSVIANPMSVYPSYKARRTSWGIDALGTAIVEVESESGEIGLGQT